MSDDISDATWVKWLKWGHVALVLLLGGIGGTIIRFYGFVGFGLTASWSIVLFMLDLIDKERDALKKGTR